MKIYWPTRRNRVGFSNRKSFLAGPGSPRKCETCIRADWAAHFLMGFAYAIGEKSDWKFGTVVEDQVTSAGRESLTYRARSSNYDTSK